MGRKALVALSLCLLTLGLTAFVAADEGHKEPTQVTATCSSTSALVSWAAVQDGHLSGYDVYRKVSSETEYTLANPALVTTTSYTVTGLSSGLAYDFAAIAVYNDGHTSALSESARCTTS